MLTVNDYRFYNAAFRKLFRAEIQSRRNRTRSHAGAATMRL
jgi:hypothetical protein